MAVTIMGSCWRSESMANMSSNYLQYYRLKQRQIALYQQLVQQHSASTLMKNSQVTIYKKQYEARKKLFLQDPHSDFFVILREKIYPLNRNFLTDVHYFATQEISDEKVHMLSDQIDSKYFQMIMGYFYGFCLQYERAWGIELLIKTIDFLKINSILKKMYQDIQNNFDDYGFFLLVNIAKKFNLKWLLIKCYQQLTLMNFEQLNFNRYDLLLLDRYSFEQIIKLHELLRINQNIIGLREQDLKRIIKQYCMVNNTEQFDLQSIFNNDSTLDQEATSDFEEMQTRKRNNSQPEMSVTQKISKEHLNKAMITDISLIPDNNRRVEFDDEEKSDDVYRLKVINHQIQEKGAKLLQQISKVKQSFKNKEENDAFENFSSIDEKFKRFEKTFKLQQQKCQLLKKQMQKLSPSPKQPPRSKNMQSPSSSTRHHMQQSMAMDVSMNIPDGGKKNPKSENNLFQSIPKLGKDQNFDV